MYLNVLIISQRILAIRNKVYKHVDDKTLDN
jgi:hypothetical protein